jgi:hypothetical protein
MASGNDFRVALSKESTYGTRVAPARFFAITGEGIEFTRNRAFSAALGMGRWTRPSVLTNRSGAGPINGEVPSTGFRVSARRTTRQHRYAGAAGSDASVSADPHAGHGTFEVVQHAEADAASHEQHARAVGLHGAWSWGGISFAWTTNGLLTYSIPTVVQDETTGQTLATYVAPTAWLPYGYGAGSATIASVAETNVMGDGNVSIGYNLRDDAYALGTSGTMAKPVETDKPTATASFTADFNDLTNVTRVINNTVADLVLRFTGATISGTYTSYIEVTLKDCVFTTASPTADGPGPVQQSVTVTAASSSGNAPIIKYQSTDTTL